MICGTFTVSNVPDDQLAHTMQGFRDNDPPPLNVTARIEADGSNSVIAEFSACRMDTSHDPGPQGDLAHPPVVGPGVGRPSSKTQLARQAFRILTSNNTWSAAQACGIIANIEGESSFDLHAVGDGGTAFGLCQWHPDRQRNFRGHFGHDMQSSNFDEQVQFITFEMVQGSETQAGSHLRAINAPKEAGKSVSLFYERPNDPNGSVSNHRGDRAVFWFQTLA